MKWRWSEGYSPFAPKDVTADQVMAALKKLDEPSPTALFEASKDEGHVLHAAVWGEGDQVWANRGRISYCRRLIGGVRKTVVVGKTTLEVRAVEFVKPDGESRHVMIDDIMDDPELRDAYLAEIVRLQDQAVAKLTNYREMSKPTK